MVRRRTSKTRKLRRTLKKKGGSGTNTSKDHTVRVDVRQITITEPIKQAINSLTVGEPINLSKFKRAPGHPGFALPRIEDIRGKNIRANLELYPIELETVRNREGRAYGVAIDGAKVPLYTIVNGRHRFAKAVADGLRTVNAVIIS